MLYQFDNFLSTSFKRGRTGIINLPCRLTRSMRQFETCCELLRLTVYEMIEKCGNPFLLTCPDQLLNRIVKSLETL